jgi:DnaJ-class molecular chaperone
MAKKIEVPCPQCNGKGKKKYPGKTYEEACSYCAGTGKVEKYV